MSYRWCFVITIYLFGVGLVLGLAVPTSVALFSEEIAVLRKMADFLGTLPRSSIFAFIFVKNVSALLLSLVLSPIFCLVPVVALVSNGWLIGVVSNAVIKEVSLGYLLAGLLPHGIFELPAFILGEAVALSLGSRVLLALLRKERGNILIDLRKSSRYLALVLILLLLAAIIEAYITPLFLG
ncbi:stage II sporulation protein M [Chloroflexota bacterium]